MKTAEEEVAQILADGITFSPQTGAYVIHRAIEELIKWRRAYARQALEEAAERANVEYVGNLLSDPSTSIELTHPDGSVFKVHKQSILQIISELK
jgi:hypothetical protein